MGTELKTDASQRWMMYSRDAYENGRIFLTHEQKQAADDGKRFAQLAHADVWARNATLVQRVRSFLGANFHWHQRLAKAGTDLEVIQTLQSMIRGESVVLISENPPLGGSIARGLLPPSSGDAMGFIDAAAVQLTSWAKSATYSPGEPVLSGPYDAGAQQTKLIAARNETVTDSLSSDFSTPLGDARPFEYEADTTVGDSFEIAKTPNLGDPGWYTNPGSGQMRLFGDDRKPIVDLDFDHIHNGLQPHAHNWGLDGRDSGNDVVPFSPWNP